MTNRQTPNSRTASEPTTQKASRVLVALLALMACLPFTAARAAEHREDLSRKFPIDGSGSVSLENLAGRIQIEGASGSQIEVEIEVIAVDDSKSVAQELAGRVSLEADRRGDRLVLLAKYPVEDYDDYHYPGRGKSSSSSSWFGWGSRTNTRYQGRTINIHGKPGRGTITLYANIVLRLPAGLAAEVRNVAGSIEAQGIRGDLTLDTGAGSIIARDGEGNLLGDTGSGNLEVSRYNGNVNADTGSGDVTLEAIVGNVEVDTGSGAVNLRDIQADSVVADTGSGDIRLDSVEGSLSADTGSGEVIGRNLVLSGRLNADTGSGDVFLDGDFAQVDRILIDTGSGDVTLVGTSFPGMDLRIDTGSGDIDVDLPGADVIVAKNSEYHARFGNGSARAVIGTGSGDVTLEER